MIRKRKYIFILINIFWKNQVLLEFIQMIILLLYGSKQRI